MKGGPRHKVCVFSKNLFINEKYTLLPLFWCIPSKILLRKVLFVVSFFLVSLYRFCFHFWNKKLKKRLNRAVNNYNIKRKKGFEPSTFALATQYSTIELFPLFFVSIPFLMYPFLFWEKGWNQFSAPFPDKNIIFEGTPVF